MIQETKAIKSDGTLWAWERNDVGRLEMWNTTIEIHHNLEIYDPEAI